MSSQSENNKRIAKNTLMLYVRMLFSMVVSLYTSRVIYAGTIRLWHLQLKFI